MILGAVSSLITDRVRHIGEALHTPECCWYLHKSTSRPEWHVYAVWNRKVLLATAPDCQSALERALYELTELYPTASRPN